jgi:hypothetical protein
MANFDFVIDDQSVGQTIGPQDGFLVSLVVTQPPLKYVVADWDEGKMQWKSGYLQLRGSGDSQNIFCSNPHQWGYLSKFLVQNHSLGYRGGLVVVCVPKGAVFSLTLSDIPNDKTLLATPSNLVEQGRKLVELVMAERGLR